MASFVACCALGDSKLETVKLLTDSLQRVPHRHLRGTGRVKTADFELLFGHGENVVTSPGRP